MEIIKKKKTFLHVCYTGGGGDDGYEVLFIFFKNKNNFMTTLRAEKCLFRKFTYTI